MAASAIPETTTLSPGSTAMLGRSAALILALGSTRTVSSCGRFSGTGASGSSGFERRARALIIWALMFSMEAGVPDISTFAALAIAKTCDFETFCEMLMTTRLRISMRKISIIVIVESASTKPGQ